MDDAGMLRLLGVNPAALDPAPARMRGHLQQRVGLPCVACQEPAAYTTIADVPGYGRRWVDCCCAHFLAVMKRPVAGPTRSMEELLAEVREVAAEVGVPRRVVITDDDLRSWPSAILGSTKEGPCTRSAGRPSPTTERTWMPGSR